MVENQEEIVAHVIVVPESCLHDARPFSSTSDPFHLLVEKIYANLPSFRQPS